MVYANRPFAGPQQIFSYLACYTHRVALSNHRILKADDHAVTIRTRAGQSATMTPETFIARFLQHVLPDGFKKIRHFGLMAPSNVNSRLAADSPVCPRCGCERTVRLLIVSSHTSSSTSRGPHDPALEGIDRPCSTHQPRLVCFDPSPTKQNRAHRPTLSLSTSPRIGKKLSSCADVDKRAGSDHDETSI